MRFTLLVLLAAALASIAATCQVRVLTDLGSPTAMSFAPDGDVFIARKDGVVLRSHAGVTETVFTVDTEDEGEAGLVGIAIDPQWTTTPYVYVFYTHGELFNVRISRFMLGSEEEQILLELPNERPVTGHIGGALGFGPDGMLYVGTGEGIRFTKGGQARAQLPTDLHGKILRIAPDGTVPENPWANEVWAIGLRNPFTFAFAPDGRLYVNDVGQANFEEVNHVERGKNYGWPICEGACSKHTAPIFAYAHGVDGVAITGGVFHEGSYYFADFAAGWIKRLEADGTATMILDPADTPVDLDVYEGRLHYLSLSGHIYRVAP